MCLSTVYSKKKRDELIAKHQKNGFITVWKVFRLMRKHYTGSYLPYKFYGGINKTKYKINYYGYRIAFHSFLNRKAALAWRCVHCDTGKIIKCRIPIKSILATGTSPMWTTNKFFTGETIVSTEIICPKYFGKRK